MKEQEAEEVQEEGWSYLLSWRSIAAPRLPSPPSCEAWPAQRPQKATQRGLLQDQDGLHCPMVPARGLHDLRHCPTSDSMIRVNDLQRQLNINKDKDSCNSKHNTHLYGTQSINSKIIHIMVLISTIALLRLNLSINL